MRHIARRYHALSFRTLRPLVLVLGAFAISPLLGGEGLGQQEGISGSKKFDQEDKFRQLEEILPTPNGYRTASGAPGHEYWQQSADYVIDVRIDDEAQRLIGSETITYTNHSPDTLGYLWLQLDANIYSPESSASLIRTAPSFDNMNFRTLQRLEFAKDFDGSVKVSAVKGATGQALSHHIVGTMMRVDLPAPLESGNSTTFSVDWSYQINRSDRVRGRTGCEFFEKDGNYIYEMAQWFPRMVAYTDVNGWQHKQFLGRGEFTLEFGDYLVRITVPSDHIVASTGELQNSREVLSDSMLERLEQARDAEKPMFIVNPEEALDHQASRADSEKTWVFAAKNVRDFAFATSRKFIWDAKGHTVGDRTVMAMSYYPNEGEPLWSRYSTHAIVHTLDVYSRYTFDYPYPVAISVNGPVGGMEYPMICFNGPRPEEDGTYSKRTKYGLISVIIHEVGHNYFPMIVNSDERQWTWMDEGLNTFLQYLTEQEWEEDYPSRRGEAQNITGFMASPNQVPIMTNSESLLQFGNNAYAKPATALNVLRETILGRELFDFAFKTYSQRWQFKRPMPSDFFRTMEDASGIDLDWFWRGWFYSTDHTDLAITDVEMFEVEPGEPELEKARLREEREASPVTLSQERNKDLPKRTEAFPELLDFYNKYDELDVTGEDRKTFEKYMESLEDEQRELLNSANQNFYRISLANVGGLVMPIILRMHFEDGSHEDTRIPAEIWRQNNEGTTKLIVTDKKVARIELDPYLETADVDRSNNHYPPRLEESRFKLFKGRDSKRSNPMQKAIKEENESEAEKTAQESEGSDSNR